MYLGNGQSYELCLFFIQKSIFCAKSQQKNYSTENKVIGR